MATEEAWQQGLEGEAGVQSEAVRKGHMAVVGGKWPIRPEKEMQLTLLCSLPHSAHTENGESSFSVVDIARTTANIPLLIEDCLLT